MMISIAERTIILLSVLLVIKKYIIVTVKFIAVETENMYFIGD